MIEDGEGDNAGLPRAEGGARNDGMRDAQDERECDDAGLPRAKGGARNDGQRVDPSTPPSPLASDPSTIGSSANGPPPPAELGAELRVCPGKNRIVQVVAGGGRKLFDARRREVFLEWFAATCNARLAAAKAGVAYQTVFKHRMKDEEFARRWDAALAQGYARLEARVVLEVGGGVPPLPAQAAPGSSPGLRRANEDESVPFDPLLAIAVLREQKRNVHGRTPKAQRTTARAASNKEIAEALAKRLKGFALRVGKGSKKS
jgi:hypothetical protein